MIQGNQNSINKALLGLLLGSLQNPENIKNESDQKIKQMNPCKNNENNRKAK